jgi:ABC-2 type transport system ATP-binding protein
MIALRHLSKHYEVQTRAPGLGAALRALFHRTFSTVKAIDDVSFEIAAGERVGLLGPNGAGKTTTLKVLSGLLYPTAGEVAVAGHDPSKREDAFLKKVTLVLGQKQQLHWDLPPLETFELNRILYDVPRAEYDETLRELTLLLDIDLVARRPTRQLSLGERMKCELAAALIHRPKVLFLDEPTLGLDVAMQVTLRDFVKRYNERSGATLVLTSHYMDDVVALCPRVIVIGKGKVVYDGALDALARRVRPYKHVVVRLSRPVAREDLERLGAIVRHDDTEAVLRVDPEQVRDAFAQALAALPLVDLTVENPPIEEVMAEVFATVEPAADAREAKAP